MGNYDAGVNDRKGINISWSEYDSSAQEHVFTFDTPMGDSNYVVVTDRSDYEDTNAIYIKYKSTTGFTAEWVGADPDVFSGSFIVYDQHLQKRLVVVKTGLTQMIIWQVCAMYMEHLMMKLMHGMLSLHQ